MFSRIFRATRAFAPVALLALPLFFFGCSGGEEEAAPKASASAVTTDPEPATGDPANSAAGPEAAGAPAEGAERAAVTEEVPATEPETPAEPAEEPKAEMQPAAAAADEPTATAILDMALAQWGDVQDYRCTMITWNKLGDEVDEKKLQFTFKKPQAARSHVLEGKNQGGTVTRDNNGVMKGKKGGVLGLVVLTVKEDDDRIRNIRGKKFYDANFGTILGEFAEGREHGWKLTRLPDEAVDSTDCYCIELEWADPKSAVTRDLLWISKDEHIVRRRRQFEGETKVNDARYWDFQFNQNFDDSEFTL